MKKIIINSEEAPEAIGPYNQGVIAEHAGLLFSSGQLGLDPATGLFAGQDAVSQAEQALNNLKVVLEKAGTSLENVIKTTVYLADIKDFKKVNKIYEDFFKKDQPARSAVEVSALPKGALVEIECIALVEK